MALGKKANKKTDNMKSKSGGSIFKKKSAPIKKGVNQRLLYHWILEAVI